MMVYSYSKHLIFSKHSALFLFGILILNKSISQTVPNAELGAVNALGSNQFYGNSPVSGEPKNQLKRGLIIEPRISSTLTYSDNVKYSNKKEGDFLTEITPGIRISSVGGKVRGSLDYSLHQFYYAAKTLPSSSRSELDGLTNIELVEKKLFLDMGARISRQVISVFGVQPVDANPNIGNTTKTSTYFVSPYTKGRLLNTANYELRYKKSISTSELVSTSDLSTQEIYGSLREEYAQRYFGWATEILKSSIDYKINRDVESLRTRASLIFIITPQFKSFLTAGRETNNYISNGQTSYKDFAYGIKWRPSTRTRVDIERQNRFFGNGHDIAIDHRMQRLSFRFTDKKDVVVGRGLEIIGSANSLYDILYNQFASFEPDPERRSQLVNQYLQNNSINSRNSSDLSIFSASTTLRRDQQFGSFLARNT